MPICLHRPCFTSACLVTMYSPVLLKLLSCGYAQPPFIWRESRVVLLFSPNRSGKATVYPRRPWSHGITCMPLLCSIVGHSVCNLTGNFKELWQAYDFADIMEKDV